jgi:hypothetical protein
MSDPQSVTTTYGYDTLNRPTSLGNDKRAGTSRVRPQESKREKRFVSAIVGIAEKRQSARVGQICIADQVANNVR